MRLKIFVLLAAAFVVLCGGGCNPEFADTLDRQLTDPDSALQQSTGTTAEVVNQVSETLRLVPFVPYAKEATVGLGVFSVLLNAVQSLRNTKLKTACNEIVQGAEAFKDKATADSVQAFKDEQAKAQSKDTKVLVAELKAT